MRTKNRPIEVLAPAGSMECLKAAILNGADAVYLGGEMFGARAYAGNFNKEELLEAIDYVHLYGKKLFLTVNTLMKEEELPLLPGFLKPFYEQGLDAVIVQDLGAVSVIRKHFPKLEIHASTQMTITGVHGARIAKEMGAKRVVPARELSLEEIQEIKDDTGLDMECFVHGALCYCYSGQCFMSSMLGGRSGNRGRCAGTCRLPFYLDGTKNTKNAYPLSLKDLCTIEHLPEILDHGVDSLKIEGRMKGPRYVGEVTRIYRKYVDLYLSEKPYKVESEDLKILMEVFNRGGFTGGYYKEYHGKDMMSMKRPDHQGLYVGKISKLMKGKISFTAQEDIHKGDALQIRINSEEKVELTSPSEFKAGSKVVLNGQKMKKLHEGMEIKRTLNHPMIERIDEGLKQKKKENLKGKIIIQKDQCAKLILKDGEDHVEVIGPVIEEAKKNGAMPADIEKLLKKTGQTHYTFEELEVDLGENLFVPGSVLKKLRKEAFAQMDQAKILKYRRTYEDPVKENDVASSQEQEESKIQIAVSMENLEYLDIVTEDREVMKIYLSWMELKQQEDPQSILNKIKTAGKQCYLMLPQIARKRQMEELKAKKDLIFTNEIDGLLVRNLEEFSWLIEEGYQKEMIADYMFYGYNKEAVKEYQRLSGIQIRMTYPSELNKKEMEQLELLNADLFLYGYQPLMVSAQCVKNNLRGCDKTPSWLTLKDRYNANFFVHTSCCDCINEIYNGKPLWVGNEAGILNDLHPSVIRFHITRENEMQVKEILNAAKSIQKGERASLATEYTTGHLKREVL